MIEQLLAADEALFLWLNGFHNEFWDLIMVFFTKKNTWLPLYLFTIAFLFWKFGWKKGGLIVFATLVAVGLANTLTSEIMKPFFGRLRPCKEDSLNGLIHLPHTCGGKYSFASSHASNTFAFAGMMFFALGKELKTSTIILLAWAAVVSYSRIYVGVHYPLDIVVGGLLGYMIAWVVNQQLLRRLLRLVLP